MNVVAPLLRTLQKVVLYESTCQIYLAKFRRQRLPDEQVRVGAPSKPEFINAIAGCQTSLVVLEVIAPHTFITPAHGSY